MGKTRDPKPVTRDRLERIALHYLERFSASAEGVRQILRRRVDRAARVHETDREQADAWVREVVDTLVRAGLVDDRLFAEGKARSLFRKGEPPARIRQALASKGVDGATIDAALAETLEVSENPELDAARAYCKRRRLGPFRRDPDGRAEAFRKDLGALARRGFSSAIAHRVLNEDPDE
jgi:regulatory protein